MVHRRDKTRPDGCKSTMVFDSHENRGLADNFINSHARARPAPRIIVHGSIDKQ